MDVFSTLSDELTLLILTYLDVPELLAISRTSHHFRRLSFDPVLHIKRLQTASRRLSLTLPLRPPLSSLLPPVSTIYLSTTHVLARKLSRKLVAIRLNRNLLRRPSASSLVHCNILPGECCRCDKSTGEVIYGGGLAPGIVEVKRKVERERVKDGLRVSLERKASKMEAEQINGEAKEKLSVRGLVRKFTASKKDGGGAEYRWGRKIRDKGRCEPARANVLGLRRFWEGLATAQDMMIR